MNKIAYNLGLIVMIYTLVFNYYKILKLFSLITQLLGKQDVWHGDFYFFNRSGTTMLPPWKNCSHSIHIQEGSYFVSLNTVEHCPNDKCVYGWGRQFNKKTMEIIWTMWHILKIFFWYDLFPYKIIIHITSNSCLEISKLGIFKLLIEILLLLTLYFISSTDLVS